MKWLLAFVVAADVLAATAFVLRARMLGGLGQGWPDAPLSVRVAVELMALALFLRAVELALSERVVALAEAMLALAVLIYAVVLLVNVARQRRAP